MVVHTWRFSVVTAAQTEHDDLSIQQDRIRPGLIVQESTDCLAGAASSSIANAAPSLVPYTLSIRVSSNVCFFAFAFCVASMSNAELLAEHLKRTFSGWALHTDKDGSLGMERLSWLRRCEGSWLAKQMSVRETFESSKQFLMWVIEREFDPSGDDTQVDWITGMAYM